MEKAPHTKRPRYDAAFRAEALRLASESRSTLAAARALNIKPNCSTSGRKRLNSPCPLTRKRRPRCAPCGRKCVGKLRNWRF